MAADAPILDIKGINTFYDEAHVLQNVDLKVMEGEAVALLGRNGAGKTTTLRSIMGLSPARSWKHQLQGPGHHQNDHQRHSQPGPGLGAGQPAHLSHPLGAAESGDSSARPALKAKRHWDLQRVYDHFPKLKILAKRKGDNLSGGEQQMLSIARTLMGNPDMILLDEPSEGLAPLIVKDVMNVIVELTQMNITTILVEQNAPMALKVCSRVYVLDDGQNAHECSAADLVADDELMQRLLCV